MPDHRTAITRRKFLRSASLGAVGALYGTELAASAPSPPEEKRPNFLVICTDQQHWQAAGYQDSFYDTPHQDLLAETGVVFEQAFCPTPQCSPSRSSLYTGLYPHKTGVKGNVGAAGYEPMHQRTIGALLRQIGYHTGYFGKWHLSSNPLSTAGWDEHDFKMNDRRATEKSVVFLDETSASDVPFALFVNYLNPHDIYHYQPGESEVQENGSLPESWYMETFADKPKAQRQFMTENQGTLLWEHPKPHWAGYRDFYRQKVEQVDEQIGQVLAALKRTGLWERTIVLLTSDHGDMDTYHRLIFKGPFMYEHLIRVPFIVRVPERFGGGLPRRITTYDVVLTDVVPTLLDFAEAGALPSDGKSLRPFLTGMGTMPRRDYVVGQYHGKQRWVEPIRMIRTTDFKYNRYLDHAVELYDLHNDPEELVNLAGDPGYAHVQQELKTKLDQWLKRNDDPFYSLKPTPMGDVDIQLGPVQH